MNAGTPCLVWLHGRAPLVGRFVRADVMGGERIAWVRFDGPGSMPCEVCFAEEIVSEAQPAVLRAFNGDSVRCSVWGRA